MAPEISNFIDDLGSWALEIKKRLKMRKPQQGIDYTSSEYNKTVQRIVSAIHPKKMKLDLAEIIVESPTTKTFRFKRMDGGFPPFRAGQYVNLFVEIGGVRTSRPYSISSAPGSDHLDLTVRIKTDGFVSPYLLNEAKVGDKFESSGPAGSFYDEPLIDRGELVFLAGGSGVTPFASMIRDFANKGWPKRFHLIYGCRTLDDVPFRSEFDRLSARNDKFNYALVLSEPSLDYRGVSGFIGSDLIRRHIGEIKDQTFLICGPNAMYDHVIGELKELGISSHKIRREAYGPPSPITMAPGWPEGISEDNEFNIDVAGHGSFKARAGEQIMNAMEREGIVVRAQCRTGKCSLCRMKLLSGKVYMPPGTGLRRSDAENSYIHSCVAYPISDISLRF